MAAAAAAEGRKAWRAAASAFSTCLLLPVRHSDLCDLINLQLLPVIATCAKFRLSGIEV